MIFARRSRSARRRVAAVHALRRVNAVLAVFGEALHLSSRNARPDVFAPARRRINATLAAFDEALDLLARSERPIADVLTAADIDVPKALQQFERGHADAVARARAARQDLASMLTMAKEWGDRASKAIRYDRPDLADLVMRRQQEYEVYARHLQDDVKAWDEIVRSYERAMAQLRARLPAPTPDVGPG